MHFNETKSEADKLLAEMAEETLNDAGGPAFEPTSPEMGLYTVVVNNLLENAYYAEDSEMLGRVLRRFNEAAESDPEFVLQLAAYAREEMYLRDISQVLFVLAAHDDRTQEYVREYAPQVIQRADEPMTCIAIWNELYDSDTVPKPLKKGINDALEQFDAYQFAKYDSDRRQVNLRDVFNLTHPKASDSHRQELHDRIMWGHLDDYPEVEPLDTPETWEATISEMGNTREAWEEVLARMGMFARIRNLRNMVEAGVQPLDILDTPMTGEDYETGEEFVISEDGMDLDEVRRRKLYPFRFYQAYRALQEASTPAPDPLLRWLSDAVDVAGEELPDRLADTAVAVDISGSMRHPVSGNSTLTSKEIAALFGGVLGSKGADVWAFASDTSFVTFHPATPSIEMAEKIMRQSVGGSTNGWKVMARLLEEQREYSRIVYLTDMQLWDSTAYSRRSQRSLSALFEEYDRSVEGEPRVYMMDLQSYGSLQFPENDPRIVHINGWTDKVLDFIEYAEEPDAALEDVRSISP